MLKNHVIYTRADEAIFFSNFFCSSQSYSHDAGNTVKRQITTSEMRIQIPFSKLLYFFFYFTKKGLRENSTEGKTQWQRKVEHNGVVA